MRLPLPAPLSRRPAPTRSRSASRRLGLNVLLAFGLGLTACETEMSPQDEAGRAGDGRQEAAGPAPADPSEPGSQAAVDDGGGGDPDGRGGASSLAPAEARPPLPPEATRLAVAQAALAEGEPAAALALVLGTPAAALTPAAATPSHPLAPASTGDAGGSRETPGPSAGADAAADSSRPPPGARPGPPLGGPALDEALRRLPPVAIRLYAQALSAAGRPRGAAQAWETLAQALPALADRFWLEAGSAHFKAGDDAAALRAFDAALASQAAGPERSADQRSLAQLRRGNALLRLGRAAEALRAYGAAELPEASEMARAQAMAGAIAAQLAAGRPDEAAALRLRLLRELPGSPLAPTALARLKEAGIAVPPLDEARVLAAAGDTEAATTLEALDPPASPAPADAASFLRAARAGDGGAWFRAGWAAWRQGLPGEAQAAWEEGLAALGEDARSAARVAQLHHWAGRAAAAQGDASAAAVHRGLAEATAPLSPYGLLARALRQGGDLAQSEPLAAIVPEGPASAEAGELDEARAAIAPDLARAEAWLLLLEPEAAEQALAGSLERLKAAGGRGDAAGLAGLARAADGLELRTITQLAGAAAIEAAAPGRLEDVDLRLLALAYPRRHHAAALQRAAREAGLPPELLLALVRQESRFREDAVSHLGALGLTQMMPDTGRQVAGWLGEADFDPRQLLDPYRSLRYGAAYLDWVLERYGGRLWPALAAYNAGPGPVDRWLAASGGEMDVFLETIDYPETAAYLRGTAVGMALYRWQATGP